MKNGIITGAIVLAGIGGLVLLNDDGSKAKSYYREYTDKNCEDFSSQREAQAFFEGQGGPVNDRHNLDRDRDGIACESI
jgi:hypothetical protein